MHRRARWCRVCGQAFKGAPWSTVCPGCKSEGMKRMGDSVSHPSHYASGEIECKDAMREAMTGADIAFVTRIDGVPRYKGITPMAHYWWGCAFKYLWRWARKGGLEDLRKCEQCIEFIIEEMERQDG